MNQQAFEFGKSAYDKGDWLVAVSQLGLAKDSGEVNGQIDHLLGNAYMKLGQFDNAAAAYQNALADVSYGKVGALSTNEGRALLAAGKVQEAISVLTNAIQDVSYATPYKAQLALGSAYEQIGDIRNAGIAYRNAAVDEKNPNPSSALRSLGACFMGLNRPVDAVEAYRTALDFANPLENSNQIYADLGLAYVAANRMSEAVDAFTHASTDGTYTLTDQQQSAFDAARKAISAIRSHKPSETDAFLQAAGYDAYDPLDPTGQSGELIPSAEDTGFFQITEQEIIEQDKKEKKIRRKHRHTGLKVFFTILILLILVVGGAGFAYYRGYGWPTQQSVVQDIFSAKAQGTDIGRYVSSSVSSTTLQQISNSLPSSSQVTLNGVDQSMTKSTVNASVNLSNGGTVDYTIELVRDGIGWKVASVSTSYVSQNSQAPSANASSSTGTTSGNSNSGTTANSGTTSSSNSNSGSTNTTGSSSNSSNNTSGSQGSSN